MSPIVTAAAGCAAAGGAPDLEGAGGGACGTWTAFDWKAAAQAIPERVHRLALAHPDRPAAFDHETRVTYGELDRAANRLANALLARRSAMPEPILFVCDAGVPAIVAVLGIMKAGKHAVGVEAALSQQRIEQIADDAGATVVVADRANLARARAWTGPTRDVIACDGPGVGNDATPEVAIGLDAIAVLHYTSGSTGMPKGVVQSHRSAIGQVTRYANACRLGDADRLGSFESLAWSGLFWSTFGPLCLGSCAGMFDLRRFGLDALVAWLHRTGVTAVSGLVTVRRIAFGFPDARFPHVRLVQMGGDTVYRRDVVACRRVFPNAIADVGLGLSEAGRAARQFIAPGAALAHEIVPVGFAVPGVRVLLVGANGDEAEPGDVGEILLQAEDLAVGYRNLPAVTAERFRHDPRHGSAPLYVTGDLGRRLPDGSLLHLGRKDFEVKVRGHRVPVNQIEAMLLEMPGVRDACVVVQPLPDAHEQLVAFLVRAQDERRSVAELQAGLRGAVPDHMVPQRFVDLDALPKTPTGKTDRRALPVAPPVRGDLGVAYAAPRSSLEARIATIWGEALRIDRIGVDDDFIVLGGDSLHAMQIVSRVLRDLGIELSMPALLDQSTVAKMAALVAGVPLPSRVEVGEAGMENS